LLLHRFTSPCLVLCFPLPAPPTFYPLSLHDALPISNIKRLIAASSIAHMGFILIGTYAGTATALQGVVMLVVAHALSSAGLFIMSGQIHERLHTREMPQMGGLFGRVGALSGFGLAFIMATLGMPG